jgi:hypothetical protein
MPKGVYERTPEMLRSYSETQRRVWGSGNRRTPGGCAEGCTCGRHRPKTEAEKRHRSLANIGKNVGKKHGPPSEEHREKNRQAQLGNQHARGAKHTAEMRARRGQLSRQMWLDGMFDHKHPCWGKPGVHAGVKMHCLNSEGVFARDCDEAGIAWRYEPCRFKLSWCTYRPDFYLPEFDIWVEVKGYPEQPGQWKRKVESFRKETGKTIIVVFQRELSCLTYEVGG